MSVEDELRLNIRVEKVAAPKSQWEVFSEIVLTIFGCLAIFLLIFIFTDLAARSSARTHQTDEARKLRDRIGNQDLDLNHMREELRLLRRQLHLPIRPLLEDRPVPDNGRENG